MKRTTSFLAKASMMLLAVLFSLTGARAQNELTVYDGADQTSVVPFHGHFADYGTRSQFIIPAIELNEMAGGSINKLTFYAAAESANFDEGVTVYLKEVDYSTFESEAMENWDEMTGVYTGNIAVSGYTMEIEFDSPYTYGGKNLMIGFQVTTWGSSCPNFKWYGENQAEGSYTAVYNNANSSHEWGSTPTRITFIPKTTFTYTGGSGVSVEKPQTFEVSSITSSEAVLTWTGGTGIFNLEYKKVDDADWTVVLANTTSYTYTLTGLESATAYQARVQSVSGSNVSGWKTLNFTTAATFPFIEDFTAGLPATWMRYTGLLDDILGGATLATTTSRWKVGTDNSVLDDAHALANIYGTGTQHWLVTPAILLPANAQIAFDVAYTAYNGTATDPAQTGEDDKFVVLISTDDMATWTILRQWDNAGSPFVLNNLTPAGENVAISLNAYAGQNVNVAFYVESTASNADNNLHIDNVAFQEKTAVVCEKPIGLKVNYDGGTEATVSWVSEEPYFDIDVNGTITEDVENPYTLTNLELATTYTIKVRAKNVNGVSEWAGPVSFATKISDDMCQIKLVLIDSYGDSWNGNAIKIVDVATGIEIDRVTLESGSEGTFTVNVPNDRDIEFQWVSGSYANECSYTAYDVSGEEIFSGSGAMTTPVTYHVDCVVSPFRTPTDLAASEITKNSVTLSWTEKGTATEWVINVYDETNDDSFGEFTTSENPYTLTGLTPETTYTARVRPAGENEKWSKAISFTTDVAFPAPTDVEAVPAAENAEISWTGDADAASYNLRYRESDDLFITNFEDSSLGEWTTIDADGDGYDWVLGSWVGGIYLGEDGTLAGFGKGGSHDFVTSGSYTNALAAPLTPDNWLVSPLVTLGGSISFYAGGQDAGYSNEYFGVFVSTTSNDDPDDFTQLEAWTLQADGTGTKSSRRKDQGVWGLFTVDLSAYAGQQGYVAIRHFNCTDQFMLNIDDIIIEQPIEPWTVVEDVTSPYTIEGLAPETDYQVQVQAVYAEGESQWTATSFTTKGCLDVPTDLTADVTSTTATLSWTGVQDSYNLQYRTAEVTKEFYFTNFNDGADALRAEGWNWEGSIFNGIEDPVYNIPGDKNSFLQMGYDTTEEQTIISPELPEYESGAVLEFHHFYCLTENTFQIGYSTTTNDLESFTWSEPITCETSGANAYATKYSEVLPDGVKYVAFKTTTSEKDACIFIDNFHVYKPLAEAGEWISASAIETTLTITGLTPATLYEWKVQGIYKGVPTKWSKVATFTTLATDPVPADLQTTDIAYTSAALSWTGAQDSYNLRYRSAAATDPSAPATIILEAHDVWGDGSGYQMLLDADANTYGTLFDAEYRIYVNGEQYSGGDISEEYYNEFEYKNPAEADGSLSTTNVVVDGSVTITIPAGTYDYVILNPTPGDRFYIAADYGEVGGSEDNFVFEPGVTYHFTMGKFVGGDGATLEITREWGEWTEVDNIADTSYQLTGLTPGTEHEWQVQGIYSGSTTDWSEAATFTTKELLELADNATDNSAIIAANNGKVADVQLTGRTLFKDGEWNTICLPFALDATELAASPLADGDIRTLDNIAVGGTTASLNFTAEGAVTEIEAGKPYLIRWTSGKHIVSPTFNNVVVNKTMNDVVCTAGETAVTFKGNYDKMIYSEDNTSVLFFDDDNNLDYPLAGTSIGALRGYFQLAGLTADSKEFVTNLNVYDPDGIGLTPALSEGEGDWYDLGGRKLAGKPTMKGIYVNGGRKVTIK